MQRYAMKEACLATKFEAVVPQKEPFYCLCSMHTTNKFTIPRWEKEFTRLRSFRCCHFVGFCPIFLRTSIGENHFGACVGFVVDSHLRKDIAFK
jgi:hypothetical protein